MHSRTFVNHRERNSEIWSCAPYFISARLPPNGKEFCEIEFPINPAVTVRRVPEYRAYNILVNDLACDDFHTWTPLPRRSWDCLTSV
jgi:hypothetical protein